MNINNAGVLSAIVENCKLLHQIENRVSPFSITKNKENFYD